MISGDFGTLMAALISSVAMLFGYALMGVATIVAYTLVGLVLGMIVAFCFNLVVKLSGGLSFDAEIS